MEFRTRAIQNGVYIDDTFNSVTTPAYLSSTYFFEALGKPPKFDYSRSGNPTRSALETNLAALEGGVGACLTSSGMAAITTVLFLFKPGDHIIAGHNIYGGTYRLFDAIFRPLGYEFTFVNMCDTAEIEAAVRPNTRFIWVETPSNPLLQLTDIEAVVGIARRHGVMTIADNTFLSPYFQQPFRFGVDLVIHSTTKYINGHSDVVGGVVISPTEEMAAKIKDLTNSIGTIGSPADALLTLRGVKTLALRMEAHARNAQTLAEFLAAHPRVRKVNYPGLASHPQHELARRQLLGFGGMLSFEVDTAAIDPAVLCSRLRIIRLAESLGGVESLICQPWSMTHVSMPEEARQRGGITPALLRISVGVEDPKDLVADLEQALAG